MNLSLIPTCLGVFLALLFISCAPKSTSKLAAMDKAMPVEKSKSGPSSFSNSILGDWDYTAFATPLGDIPGRISLKKVNNLLEGTMSGNGASNEINELKSEGYKITGHIYYSDVKVNIQLAFEGSQLMGQFIVDGTGNFKVTGKRAI